ncbi:hypothetical protein [Arhodomonas sp. AD133]|uniref:hypothetical protein n=1 Tax=Arhodomonas sp. AD133 TaxID=3415009 RepID=UPI003EB6ECC8
MAQTQQPSQAGHLNTGIRNSASCPTDRSQSCHPETLEHLAVYKNALAITDERPVSLFFWIVLHERIALEYAQ